MLYIIYQGQKKGKPLYLHHVLSDSCTDLTHKLEKHRNGISLLQKFSADYAERECVITRSLE